MQSFYEKTVKKIKMRALFFCFAFLSLITGCASLPEVEGFHYEKIQTKEFSLAAWSRIESRKKPLRIYIEGDGFAWKNIYTPSTNPTPTKQMVLLLAKEDKYPNVVYLGRPCQYVTSKACRVYYWTEGRYSEEVVASMNEAVDILMKKHQALSIELVGYSGGGAIAALIAVRNPAVSRVITAAGVLDHAAWTKYHKDSPLNGSLNPADYKKKLATIKQIHFAGVSDKTVPPQLTEQFVESLGEGSKADIVIVPSVTHNSGWVSIWDRLVN